MKDFKTIFALAISTFVLVACSSEKQISQQHGSPTTEKLYFGQQKPRLIPKIFAPGVISISGRYESSVSFSPELNEIYFSAKSEEGKTSIYFSKLKDDDWIPIRRADFTKGKKNVEMHPFVSPNGKRVYFTAFDSGSPNEKIWYVDRFEHSWGDAIQLDSPINDHVVFSPNQAQNGDLFYTKFSEQSSITTHRAPNQNGKYPETQKIEIAFGHHAFISPTQDYLLVTGRNKENGERQDNDLFVYFRKQDGSWTDPINLGGAVNSERDETSPRITPDGAFLFFSRSGQGVDAGDVYWVSTDILEKVRPFYLQD